MNVSEQTKNNYLSEWRTFEKWLKLNKKSISEESANNYISNLKCRSSTAKKKQYMLEIILKIIIDQNIKLNKFRMRISTMPKWALSNEELKEYLEEQKIIENEDYVAQLLLATYGLRINTISSIKVKDLEFLKSKRNEEKMIRLPDSKVKINRVEIIDENLMNLLIEIIDENNLTDDDYIFLRHLKNLNNSRRAQEMCMKINKRISESKVLVKRENYKYSSHMFRKTKAYNIFKKKVMELKEEVRNAIGQSQGSGAIESYIN